MKKTMLSIVMMLFCVWGYAQTDNLKTEFPNLVPPSPTAYELGKYGEVPVGLFTGTPNVGIPLMEFKTKDLSIPISLSYNSNGIKVDQLATNVGLGWSLNAGGVISRTVKGRPDEERTYQFPEEIGNDYLTSSAGLDYFYTLSENNDLDSEPDSFTFNFLGRAGKFTFDNDGAIVLLNNLSLKVNYINGGFIIIDEQGITYHFYETEESRMRSFGGGHTPPDYTDVTAWYLTKIVSLNGNEINLTYTDNTYTYVTSQSQSILVGNPSRSKLNECNMTNNTYKVNPIISHELNIVGKKLATISSNNMSEGSIQFDYNYSHPSSNHSILTTVTKLYNTKDIEKINLSYLTTNNNRIFLKDIIYLDTSKKYRFEYIQPEVLPARLSFNQDHWGHYNGKNNQYLFPDPSTVKTTSNKFEFYINYGADRSLDENFEKVGLLEKVYYPTKGHSQFIYESNDYYTTESILSSSFKNVSLQTLTSSQELIKTDEEILTNINVDQLIPIDWNISYNNQCNSIDFPGDHQKVLEIQVQNLTTSQSYIIQESQSNGNVNVGNYLSLRSSDQSKNYLLNLKKDNEYRLTIKVSRQCLNGFLNITYDQGQSQMVSYNKKAPGSRLLRLENYNHSGSLVNKKKYQYTKKENLNVSSGIKPDTPYYFTLQYNSGTCQPTGSGATSCNWYTLTFDSLNSSNLRAMYDSNTQTVKYEYVIESEDDNGFEKGGIEHQFKIATNPPGFSIYGDYFGGYPISEIQWGDGQELNTTIFKKDNSNNIVKLKEVTNNYKIDNRVRDTIYGFKVVKKYIKFCTQYPHPDIRNMDNLDIAGYFINKNWHYLNQTTEKQYDNNGLNPITTTTNYFYDNPNHLQQTRVEVTNSKGEVLKTETKYAHELGDTRLINEHRIAQPLEVTTYKGTNLLNHHKTIYASSHNVSNLYLPKFIQTLKGGSNGENALDDRIVYHSYDSKGNPTEVSKADGSHIVYIWGYNQTQPIAKIENAKLSDIPNTIKSEIETASNLDIDLTTENSLRVSLDKLRNDNLCPLLSNAQVTTFTYDPLIGVTSVTDPRGQTVYYEYDEFNRLEFIKDTDGNLLKEHKYNYKN